MLGLTGSALVFLGLAATCAIGSGLFIMVEIGEINRKLPDMDQISYLGIHPVKMARIKRDYKRLYPSGRAELWRVIFQTAMFVFLALTALAAGAFHGMQR